MSHTVHSSITQEKAAQVPSPLFLIMKIGKKTDVKQVSNTCKVQLLYPKQTSQMFYADH